MNNLPLPDLLLVTWEDAYDSDHSWGNLSDWTPFGAKMINSVGYLVHRDAGRITIAQNVDYHDGELKIADCMTIPTGMVRKEKVLVKGEI